MIKAKRNDVILAATAGERLTMGSVVRAEGEPIAPPLSALVSIMNDETISIYVTHMLSSMESVLVPGSQDMKLRRVTYILRRK